MYRLLVVTSLVATISFSHYFVYNHAYSKGEESVQLLWNKDKLVQTEQVLIEQQRLQQEKQKSDERYVNEKRKAVAAAASAKSELDRLRNTLSDGNREESVGSCTKSGTNGVTGLERELLGQCAATLVSMAAEADRLETIVVGLQSYINNVCLVQGK